MHDSSPIFFLSSSLCPFSEHFPHSIFPKNLQDLWKLWYQIIPFLLIIVILRPWRFNYLNHSLSCSHSNITPVSHFCLLCRCPCWAPRSGWSSNWTPASAYFTACIHWDLPISTHLHFQTWMDSYSVWVTQLGTVGVSIPWHEPWPVEKGRWE